MNRSERLLKLLEILDSYKYPVTADRLSERLGVSKRTLYRDIQTLRNQGADIKGESGYGYVLTSGYFLPPLMLSQDEIEALLLGSQWVAQFGDIALSKAAIIAISKISKVLPPRVKETMNAVPLRVGPPADENFACEDLGVLRSAIRRQRKLQIRYKNKKGMQASYTIWPFALGYFIDQRILAAWSEEENSYSHFRTDKIEVVTTLEDIYPRRRSELFKEWRARELRKIKKS